MNPKRARCPTREHRQHLRSRLTRTFRTLQYLWSFHVRGHLDVSARAASRLKALRETAAVTVVSHRCFSVALFGFEAGRAHHIDRGYGGESGESKDGIAFFL